MAQQFKLPPNIVESQIEGLSQALAAPLTIQLPANAHWKATDNSRSVWDACGIHNVGYLDGVPGSGIYLEQYGCICYLMDKSVDGRSPCLSSVFLSICMCMTLPFK